MHTEFAKQIAEIANNINANLDGVFKNNSEMITKLAVAVFNASSQSGDKATACLIDDAFQEGVLAVAHNERSRCPYPAFSLENHWWTRGYAYESRQLEIVRLKAER